MTLLLNWRVWVALALAGGLAFSHLYAFRSGKQNVRNEWTVATAQANADARKLETLRQSRVDEAARAAVGRTAVLRRDAERARLAADGMRGTIDSLRRYAEESSDAAAKSIAAATDVLQQCTRAYSELAAIADGHASDSLTYQQSWPKP